MALSYRQNLRRKLTTKITEFIFASSLPRAPGPEHIPGSPLIYIDYERMGSGVFVYKYRRTGLWSGRIHHRKPGDRPLRRHAVRHIQIHRTCRRNKKERFLWWIRWQKDSNLPNCRPSRLLSHAKVNYRWWKKSQNRSVRSASPAWQAANGFPLSFAPNIPKLIRFSSFFSLFLRISPVHMITNAGRDRMQ